MIGLWAKSFEQLNMLPVFVLTPLSMLGGSFITLGMLPQWLRVAGLCQSLLLFHQWHPPIHARLLGSAAARLGYGFTIAVAVAMFLWVLHLYSKGYGLRE